MGRNYRKSNNKKSNNNKNLQRQGTGSRPNIPQIPKEIKDVIQNVLDEYEKAPLYLATAQFHIEDQIEKKLNPSVYGFKNLRELILSVTSKVELHIIDGDEVLLNPQCVSLSNYIQSSKFLKTIPVNREYSLKLHPENARRSLTGMVLPDRTVQRVKHFLIDLFPLGVPTKAFSRLYNAVFDNPGDMRPEIYEFQYLMDLLKREKQLFRFPNDDFLHVVAASFNQANQSEIETKVKHLPLGAASSSVVINALQWQDFTQVGNRHCVTIADRVSPSEFYVYLQRDMYTVAAERLEVCIQDFYNIGSIRKKYFCGFKNFKLGQIVCVNVQNYYFRARFVSVDVSNTVKVQLIDYGRHEIVWGHDIFYLYEQFSQLPGVALKVQLRGMQPKVHGYTENEKNIAANLTMDKLLELEIKHIGDGHAEVDLYVINQKQPLKDYTPVNPDNRKSLVDILHRKGVGDHRQLHKDFLLDRAAMRRNRMKPLPNDS